MDSLNSFSILEKGIPSDQFLRALDILQYQQQQKLQRGQMQLQRERLRLQRKQIRHQRERLQLQREQIRHRREH